MNVLVINCGSSSLKFQLINAESEEVLAKGLCERIGIDGRLTYQPEGGEKEKSDKPMPTHTEAIQYVIEALTNPETGVVKSLDEIGAVGHRMVHGGEKFSSSVVITDEVKKAVAECNDLAPLHNPANLIGVEACEKLMPNTPMVGVFDTAFHQTMPEKAYMYGLPYEYYEKYKVRRYGFHGTSHSFVSKRAAEVMGRPYEDLKTIVCHLGNGSSVTAVMNGKSVDTSMGLTPLEGVVMGTRSGSIDPAIMEFIAQKENLDIEGVMNVLNKKSGVYGLSGGLSSDFRDLTDAMNAGDKKAKIAMDVFSYSVAKYIGAYAAAMNGVDCIAFTAGIGENDDYVREQVCSYLGYLGVDFDKQINDGLRGEEKEISKPGSKVRVFVIPTNEELAIARETLALVK
ncbi:MAG TPA: acetate kinase [Candidatus Mediterraneibacter ornithocaccae]|jgi:acetate kinase|uniref:acetate kinase n=1 Tax=Mediterraneibacter glycyrrhizinilyticus TaxID=342942 RepID=UPI001F858080|nr:acetate kinase [Mediterraneibacter glycyrrhizinilyticus]MDN0061266.1 acetate kinase [Mediterraneibacter glycyrrhizinilyticus]HJA20754.1 acetate kinase [Candidatus Mediterraneibacter ornithocaccae]